MNRHLPIFQSGTGNADLRSIFLIVSLEHLTGFVFAEICLVKWILKKVEVRSIQLCKSNYRKDN